ncbi:GtrA family protein [Helicobacter didelphidarum]|uniref:GtrA family protein n=1 Tax=Helicobacter didelphidarum TaxID=2040648 RepID=A0A3D8IRB7_9HELI|nr:GtrA family protein [Helicobacter didelphidarum]RDU67466.1 GtrA family protein [Helicobacter didelphidarum]
MIKTTMTKLLNNSAFLYALVGIANTIVGYSITFGLTFLGVIPEVANTIGTIFGVLNSYILNKKFTFKSQNSHKKDFVRFGIAMGIAYIFSTIIIFITYRILNMNEYIALILGGVTYTIVGYFVSKFWAFYVPVTAKNDNFTKS